MKMQVNISRIEEIVGDDVEMKKTLLEMFLNTCDRVITTLQKSLGLSGAEVNKIWAEATHELKGAAMNLGFEELGNHCGKVEKAQLSVEQKNEAINIYKTARDDVKAILKSL